MENICLSLGCYTKLPQTGWLTDNRFYFFPQSGGWASKIKVPAWPGSGEGPLSGRRLLASFCGLLMLEGPIPEASFIRALMPFMSLYPCDLVTPFKASFPKTITQVFRISAYEFGTDRNIHSIAAKQRDGYISATYCCTTNALNIVT